MTTYFNALKRILKHCFKALDNNISEETSISLNPKLEELPDCLISDSNISEETSISLNPKLEELPDCLISFCSLLPPGYEFDKDTMIQLWIAQGFVDPKWGREMEVVANQHFEHMRRKSFMVQSRVFDMGRGRIMYKVDNVVPTSSYLRVKEAEFSSTDRESSYLLVKEAELSSTDREVQHVVLVSENFDEATFKILKSFKRLRTLLLFCQHGESINRIPYDLFLKLPHLRTLDLHGTDISELPDSICYLSSLQYLDVSGTPIKFLPESMGSLRHLQTLKMVDCINISRLPNCTSKWINLRHLDIHIVGQLISMPPGMGNLTSLQTLKGFILGKEHGYDARELKHLTDVSGSFCIGRLENISSVEEAREVDMINKKHINKLELRWRRLPDDLALLEEVFECLQPNLSLEELQISFYTGYKFPTWMSNSYLSNVVSITLFQCERSSNLPSLGGLPSLKHLLLFQMNGLRCIDDNFCRYGGSQVGAAFPKLEKLTIEEMPKLEKWTGVENGDFPCLLWLSVSCCPKLIAIPMLSVLNSLKVLEICECDELQSFPEGKLPSDLELLDIANCPLVKKRCRKPHGEDWSKIEHIPSIVIDREDMHQLKKSNMDITVIVLLNN